jgi:hypothetical protein
LEIPNNFNGVDGKKIKHGRKQKNCDNKQTSQRKKISNGKILNGL